MFFAPENTLARSFLSFSDFLFHDFHCLFFPLNNSQILRKFSLSNDSSAKLLFDADFIFRFFSLESRNLEQKLISDALPKLFFSFHSRTQTLFPFLLFSLCRCYSFANHSKILSSICRKNNSVNLFHALTAVFGDTTFLFSSSYSSSSSSSFSFHFICSYFFFLSFSFFFPFLSFLYHRT